MGLFNTSSRQYLPPGFWRPGPPQEGPGGEFASSSSTSLAPLQEVEEPRREGGCTLTKALWMLSSTK